VKFTKVRHSQKTLENKKSNILIEFREGDECANGPIRANSESVSDETDLHKCAVNSEITSNCDRGRRTINDGVTTNTAIVSDGCEGKPDASHRLFLQQV
jgi:hypothetical protein